jgi:D-alanyl-D-alanine dipeptidase
MERETHHQEGDMTETYEAPTIAERYSSAIETSDLGLGKRRKHVDLIIAAGLVPDSLATALFRLHAEYDAVRGEHRAAEARMRLREREAGKQKDDPVGKKGGLTAGQKSKAIIGAAEAEAVTAHALILAQLTSLRGAKERFGQWAVVEATRQRFMKPDREALHVAGRVLDVMLNPTCRHCDGRGFTGGGRHEQSGAPIVCRPCRGTGHRRDDIGRDDGERRFATHLLMQADAMLADAGRQIRHGLKRVEEAKRIIVMGVE